MNMTFWKGNVMYILIFEEEKLELSSDQTKKNSKILLFLIAFIIAYFIVRQSQLTTKITNMHIFVVALGPAHNSACS